MITLLLSLLLPLQQDVRFDVRAFGASGRAKDDARPAIQKAIEACAAAGGGSVCFPPGEYTSGSIELRSHVRVILDAGATVFSAKGKEAFPKEALFFGEDLEGVTLEGRGKIDGRAEYEWRENDLDDRYIHPNLVLMKAAGKSLNRAFPKKDSVGHLVRLVRCKDVLIRDLSFVRSPSWTMHLWGCERVAVTGVDIRTSLTEGVWADGIDPDGCKDVHISDCTIETGDDALVFYSTKLFGPARPCEDITVTNCRLTSSSSAIKFCDGNENCVRRVAIDNCVITNSNRGLAFMVFDGGYVSDVVISNLVIDCTRRDWFWWGDGDPIHFRVVRRHEIDPRLDAAAQPPAGSIRNVSIRNVIARGTGTSTIEGHPDRPLENVSIDGLSLRLAHDPAAPYDKSDHALKIRHARGLTLRDVRVDWEEPASNRWRSALEIESAADLTIAGFVGRQADPGGAEPAILLRKVDVARIRGCTAAPGTADFLRIAGAECRELLLLGNDLRAARRPFSFEDETAGPAALRTSGDPIRRP
jgi:polygalacturonase